ncbi:glutathione S-transferase-like [Euwallacea fornicatus]|uniref:glutathione S-transferase-like n=1 Tax=Euwallacea fornicatus TaxID=995702 RepID=UPI00338E1867
MAPKYKLTYFDFSGLGEPIRFIFHYAGIDFEDNRLNREQWAKLKPNAPLLQMPLLEVDGKTLHQSLAIARYVAKQVGLAGDNDFEAYEIDAAADTANDFRLAVVHYLSQQDPTIKQQFKEKLEDEKIPLYLNALDSWAKKNNGYLANGKISWADLYLVAVLGYLSYFLKRDLYEGYPNLKKVQDNVFANPGVNSWVQRRPTDHFPL